MSWGNPKTHSETALAALLAPAAAAYGAGAFLHKMAYRAGLLQTYHFPVPVVSIGNITCGGTGKTPVTIDLAARLEMSGRRVGILSRGYRRQSKEPLVVAGDGSGAVADSSACGDEPHMIARRLPGCVVIVSSSRAKAAQVALDRFHCDVLLLDDGFQHWPVRRDLDIVLLDYNDEPLNDRLLPAGRLRERLQALERAKCLVITKIPAIPDPGKLSALKAVIERFAPAAEISRLRFVPQCLRAIDSDTIFDIASLSGRKVVALSGIARPERFISMIEALGAQVTDRLCFSDHHWFTDKDFDRARTMLKSAGADLVITTSKDASRVKDDITGGLPLLVLELGVEWLGPVPLIDVCTLDSVRPMSESACQ